MKRFAASLLALALVFGAWTPSAEAASSMEGDILPTLSVMGVLNGDENGNMNLEGNITRAEFVKMAVSASSLKSQGQAGSRVSPYPDVPASAWHAGYITAARDGGLITGYLDGRFRPDGLVTLEEAVSVVLKAMGYSDADFTAGYPEGHLAIYRALGMDDGMTAVQGKALTRGECARLIYNSLSAKTKAGVAYASQLGYSLDSQGKVNYAALTASLAQGPVMMGNESLSSLVGFTPLTVYRDKRAANVSNIKYGDVIYYIKDTRTVWAFSQKVSGVVQAISPSTASPTSVTVSGVTSALGSSQAIYAFSDMGSVKVGDSVTLLLGTGGQCVFVETAGSRLTDTVYGVVTAVGSKATSDNMGNVTQANYIDIAATDGGTYSYPYSGKISEGTAVKVEVRDGKAAVTRVSSGVAPSGRVQSGKIGGYRLDDSTEIIDYRSTRVVRVRADRLENVVISGGDIALCMTSDNHIDRLILKGVTGDTEDYGIMLDAQISQNIMLSPSVFSYVINGVPGVYSANISVSVGDGPCAVVYKEGKISSFKGLTGRSVTGMSYYSASLQGQGTMEFSDNMQVYVRDGDNYYLSSRMNISLDTHTVRAYYDDSTENGGRIRVLVAQEK